MTAISRRRLLGLGLATAGATALSGPLRFLTPTANAATPSTPAPAGSFDLAAWASVVGSVLTVETSSGHLQHLRLHSAEALAPDRRLVGDGYRLVFWGVKDPILPDGTSIIRHPTIGRFAATVLAINQPVDHQSYQLIVDRRRPLDPEVIP